MIPSETDIPAARIELTVDSDETDDTLRLAKAGVPSAVSTLLRRHVPSLRRWAHGRIPPVLRRVADTSDLVQNAVLRTLRLLPTLDARREHVLAAYLRSAVLNQIRDEHRRLIRRGVPVLVSESLRSDAPSPLEETELALTRDRYLRALSLLSARDRELVVAHVELGYSHAQLGCMIGRNTHAARMALCRALERLSTTMLAHESS